LKFKIIFDFLTAFFSFTLEETENLREYEFMKKPKILIMLLLSIIICFDLSAQSGKMLVAVDEIIYNNIDNLYSLQNKKHPSNSRPWTLDEMDFYISKLDIQNQTKTETTLYNKIIEERDALDTSYGLGDYTRVFANVDLTAQTFVHSNTGDEEYSLFGGWAENALDYRKSFLSFGGGFSYKDSLCWFMSLEYGNSKFFNIDLGTGDIDDYYQNHTAGVESIFVTDDYDVDIYTATFDPYYSAVFSNNLYDGNRDLRAMGPYRNYLSLGSSPLTFTFARTKLNFGNSIVGNLLLDQSKHYYDYTNLSYYDDWFKVSWLNVLFDTQTTHDQKDSSNGFKIMMVTRFEIELLPKLVFTFTDTMMYEADTLGLSNLNPTYFFHNLNNREIFNSAGLFDFEYQLDSGLSIYFNLMVDQLALSNETSTEPSALGLQIGGKKIFDLGDNLMDFKFEMGFTSPQLYTRDFVDYKMATRYYTNGSGINDEDLSYVSYLSYIGFPYGADSIFTKIESTYYSLKNYTFTASYLMLLKGPTLITDAHKTIGDNNNTTIFPMEIYKMKNVIEISGTYNFDTKHPMSIYGDLSFVDNYNWTSNINTFDVEFNLKYTVKI
jgi:hypothetical protein